MKENKPPSDFGEDLTKAYVKGEKVLKIKLDTKRLIVWLFGLTLALNFIGLVSRMIEKLLGFNDTQFVRLVDVSEEANITSWFSSALLLMAALLLFVITRLKKIDQAPFSRHWGFLSLVFMFLSLDEAAKIHEMMIKPLRSLFHATGIFYYSWLIVAIPLVILFAVIYMRFVFSLPNRTRNQVIAAAFLFLAGAVGFEMLGGLFYNVELSGVYLSSILVTFEELLENLGIVIFISALMTYIKQQPAWEDLIINFD